MSKTIVTDDGPPNTFSDDRDGDTPLHSAIRSFEGDRSLVRSLLERDSSQVNVRNLKGETPLHLAVQQKRRAVELIELLLEHGADVKATTPRDGNTALHWLATSDIIERENITDELQRFQSTENELAERSHVDCAVAKILLEHGCGVNARNLEGCIPLHCAIRSFEGDISLVKFLLERDNSQVNVRNRKDESPLHLAVRNIRCSEELIEFLLERGADVKATTARDGNTALHWLALSIIEVHRRRTADNEYFVGSGMIAQILLEHGSDGNARNLNGDTPLHLAVLRRNNSYAPVTMFVHQGLDVNAANFEGDTPLHINVKTEVHDLDEFLVKTPDVNVVNSRGETPLHLAVQNEKCAQVKYIKMLLDRGADVSKKDAMGETAYQAYCRAVDKDENRRANPMLQVLLQSKERELMNSSLHVASLFYNVDSAHKLLRMGADVNSVGNFDCPPLAYAIMAYGGVEKCSTVRLLLDYGADVNQLLSWRTFGYTEVSILQLAMGAGHFWMRTDDYMTPRAVVCEHLAKLFALREKQLEKGMNFEVLSQYNRKILPRMGVGLDYYLTGKVQGYEIFKDWRSQCSEELKTMSVTEIGESRLSFLDLLLAGANEVAFYAKNKELVKAFNAKKVMFPMYQGMLDAKLAKGQWRRKLIESTAVAMSNALRFAYPSDEFFERTLSYCSNEDLMHVIEAMELNKE